MAIVIKKRRAKGVPMIDVTGAPEPNEYVVRIMKELARQAAWRDHLAALQRRKELLQ
jgi:hypothetical protein